MCFFEHARARVCLCARVRARTHMHVCMHARAMPRGEQIEPFTCCIGSFCAWFLLPANSKTVLFSAFAGDSLVCCLMPVTCGLLWSKIWVCQRHKCCRRFKAHTLRKGDRGSAGNITGRAETLERRPRWVVSSSALAVIKRDIFLKMKRVHGNDNWSCAVLYYWGLLISFPILSVHPETVKTTLCGWQDVKIRLPSNSSRVDSTPCFRLLNWLTARISIGNLADYEYALRKAGELSSVPVCSPTPTPFRLTCFSLILEPLIS